MLAAALAVLLAAGWIAPAAADHHDGGASLGPDEVGAWVRERGPERGGGRARSTGRPGLPSTWTRVSHAPAATFGIACPQGAVAIRTRHFRDGFPSRIEHVRCSAWPRPGGAAGRSLPPTTAEVRDAVVLPTSAPGINPRVRGLVGLETWLWYEGPLVRTVTVRLGGTAVTAAARVVGFEFATGDGAVYFSAEPGSEDAPAARHVYQRHGDHVVSVTVLWRGSYSFEAPGGSAGGGDLGTVRTSASRPYQVVEAQAVRTR